jgi:hypothetical protein
VNQPEDLNQNEELLPAFERDAFATELTQALRHVDPPAGFAQRVMQQAAQECAQPAESARATPARAKVFAMPRPRRWTSLWAGGALAASLLAGVLAIDQVHVRRERRQEELAQRQFEAAIRITGESLEQTRLQLQQAGVQLGN